MNRLLRIALVLLGAAEVLIAHWALLVVRGQGLSLPIAALVFVVAVVANAFLLSMARQRMRSKGLGLVFSRTWLIGSIAALCAGLLLAMSFAVLGFALWVVGLFADVGDPTWASVLALGGGVAITLGFGSILWGYLVGQRWVSVKPVELPLAGANGSLAGLRIAQITDLHIGPMMRAPKLRGYVDRINRLEPDLIVITGDIFDFDPKYVDEGCMELGRLRAKHGVFAVLGNHDVYTGTERVVAGLRQHTEIRVLRRLQASHISMLLLHLP